MTKLITMFSLVLCSFFTLSAKTITCAPIAVAKCICDCQLIVECGDKRGSIANNQIVKSVKLTVNQKDTVTINNPQMGIKDYYNITPGRAILDKELASKGITSYTKATTNEFTIDDSELKLYKDADCKQAYGDDDQYKVKSKSILSGGFINNKKVCVMNVIGPDNEKTVAGCKAVGRGTCPDVKTCIADPDVTVDNEQR